MWVYGLIRCEVTMLWFLDFGCEITQVRKRKECVPLMRAKRALSQHVSDLLLRVDIAKVDAVVFS